MSIFYIFILNSYTGSARLESVFQEQKEIKDILLKYKVDNKMFSCLFDLNMKQLFEAINQIIVTDEFQKAEQIFFIWSGHGLEDVNNNAVAIATSDNKLLFFNKFLSTFFHNIKKNIYMIVDACRTDKAKYREDTLQSIVVDGDFIMLNGTATGIVSRGKISTLFIKKMLPLLIFKSLNDSGKFIKYLKIFIEYIAPLNIKIKEKNALVKLKKDVRELIQPTIYMNARVRNNKALKEDIEELLLLTKQDISDIASTKIGIPKACQSIIDELKDHKHTMENCYKIIKKCNTECKHQLKELKICEEVCFALVQTNTKHEHINTNLKIINQLILFNNTPKYVQTRETIIRLVTLYSNLELDELFKHDNKIKQIFNNILTINFQAEFSNYNIFNIIKSKILLPIIPNSFLSQVLTFEEFAKKERINGNELTKNLRGKYIKIFEDIKIDANIIDQMKSFNIYKR